MASTTDSAPTSIEICEAIVESARIEQQSQIRQIRAASKFKSYKVILSIIAFVLAIFYAACIHIMDLIKLIEQDKKFITILVLVVFFSLANLIALFAIATEHLILILIYDIITKVTLIIPNPMTCLQCILLNSFIKELDKIHKLKHKK